MRRLAVSTVLADVAARWRQFGLGVNRADDAGGLYAGQSVVILAQSSGAEVARCGPVRCAPRIGTPAAWCRA